MNKLLTETLSWASLVSTTDYIETISSTINDIETLEVLSEKVEYDYLGFPTYTTNVEIVFQVR